MDGDKAGHASALDVFAPHRVAGTLRRHHDYVDAVGCLDQSEMHVETVCKRYGGARANMVLDMRAPSFGLKFVGHGEHQEVAPRCCVRDAHDLEPFCFGLLGRGRALTKRHGNVLGAGITQVQRVRMALAAVAKYGQLLVLDQVDVAVAIIIYAHRSFLCRRFRESRELLAQIPGDASDGGCAHGGQNMQGFMAWWFLADDMQ